MSKYIKTKDGIFENKPLEKSLGIRKGRGYEIVYKEQDIIAEADTIEELCDEFVIVSNVSIWKPYKTTRKWVETLKQAQRYKPSDKCVVYGAIWTDKGLQFVALMNSEGVLELI